MTTAARRWQLGATAVTLGVAFPVLGGNLLVLSQVLAAFDHLVAALP